MLFFQRLNLSYQLEYYILFVFLSKISPMIMAVNTVDRRYLMNSMFTVKSTEKFCETFGQETVNGRSV